MTKIYISKHADTYITTFQKSADSGGMLIGDLELPDNVAINYKDQEFKDIKKLRRGLEFFCGRIECLHETINEPRIDR